MRAAVYSTNGAARDVLRVAELPTPTPAAGEVRVKVAWSAVNPSDVKTRLGLRAKMAYPQVIPHCDGSGVIDAVGPGVEASRVGQRVWLWNAQWGRAFGTAAEFVTLPEAQAVALPDAVDLEVGACLGVPALTAYHAVSMDGGVAGKTVLVTGAAGAVGNYAVQMARLEGAATVIATVSGAAKAERAVAAGAHHVVNYREEDVVSRVKALTGGRGVDRIIEVDVAANVTSALDVVAPEGDIVPYGSGAPQVTVPFFPAISKNVRLRFFIVYNLTAADRQAGLRAVNAWLAAGTLRHQVGARFTLDDIVQAHEAVEQGTVTGKVLVGF